MRCDSILFGGHALVRMFERKIRKRDVNLIIQSGEIIFDYPKDQPYPSKLLLGFIKSRSIHVVVAHNVDDYSCVVVTAYSPSLELWQPGFHKRK